MGLISCLDPGHDPLTEIVVGLPCDRHLGHPGKLGDDALGLCSADLVPGALDDVRRSPTHDADPPLAVERGGVAGREPAAGSGRRGACVGAVEVAEEELGSRR